MIDPDKPWQNADNESFNGKFRDESTTAFESSRLLKRSRQRSNERHHAHQLEIRLERDTLRPGLTGAGNAGPDFYGSEGGDCQGTLWRGGNAFPDVLVPGFRLEKRFYNAGVKQVFHRLK